MAARANTLANAFSDKVLLEMYDRSLTDHIVNRDYEGEINKVGSKLNMLNFNRLTEKDYSGSALTADSLTENNAILTIDKQKSFYWKELILDNWKSYIKDPHSPVVSQAAGERNRNMDIYVLGFEGDVNAGNRVGTDYTTGTCEVAVTTGVVTGSGTTWVSGMVGKGFKATGHTKWYRIKTFTSVTSITIEDDLDDITSAYTGGAIAAGTTYTIEANTAVAITTGNLLQKVLDLKQKLDKAQENNFSAVPVEGRWLVVPPEFTNVLMRASGIALHVPDFYSALKQKGYIGQLVGFDVFVSNDLAGDNTDGYKILGGHKNWMTFAEKVLQARIEEDLIGDFGYAFKDLFVYGAKVPDVRRAQAASMLATF